MRSRISCSSRVFLGFLNCGQNFPESIYAHTPMQRLFICVLPNLFASKFARSNFLDFTFQRRGKSNFSASPVLDYTKSGFVTIGYNAEIVTLRPHRRSFFVDVANSPGGGVRSLKHAASFCRAAVSIRTEAFGFGVLSVFLHHVRVGEWVKVRIVHLILAVASTPVLVVNIDANETVPRTLFARKRHNDKWLSVWFVVEIEIKREFFRSHDHEHEVVGACSLPHSQHHEHIPG